MWLAAARFSEDIRVISNISLRGISLRDGDRVVGAFGYWRNTGKFVLSAKRSSQSGSFDLIRFTVTQLAMLDQERAGALERELAALEQQRAAAAARASSSAWS